MIPMSSSTPHIPQERWSEVDVVEIKDLKVDYNYQRPLNPTRIVKLAADYDSVLAGVITVSARKDGTKYIVDGQHRAFAARDVGEKEILAVIVKNLTPEQEAQMFRDLNVTQSPATLKAQYKALLAAGDPTATAIEAAVIRAGGKVNRSPNTSSGINALSALFWIHERDENGIYETLTVIDEAWPELKLAGDCVKVNMLKAVWWLLVQNCKGKADVNRKDLVRKLKSATPDEIFRKAKSYGNVTGSSPWVCTYLAILDVYNHQKRNRAKAVLPT